MVGDLVVEVVSATALLKVRCANRMWVPLCQGSHHSRERMEGLVLIGHLPKVSELWTFETGGACQICEITFSTPDITHLPRIEQSAADTQPLNCVS